jgi:hypothetical protein
MHAYNASPPIVTLQSSQLGPFLESLDSMQGAVTLRHTDIKLLN